MTDLIQCRARLEQDCVHNDEGATERRSRLGGRWRDDGTYELITDSIVCDACYTRLHPILVALPAPRGREPVNLAIEVYRLHTGTTPRT